MQVASRGSSVQRRRPRGMLAAMLAIAGALRTQGGMLQRRTRKHGAAWADKGGRHGSYSRRASGAFGAQGTEDLRRFSWTRYKRWKRHLTRDKSYGAFRREVGAHALAAGDGKGLRRFAFPPGYTGPMTPARKRREAMREAFAEAGFAVRGINA